MGVKHEKYSSVPLQNNSDVWAVEYNRFAVKSRKLAVDEFLMGKSSLPG